MNLVQLIRSRQQDTPPAEQRALALPYWQQLVGGGSFLAGLQQTWSSDPSEEPISDSYEQYAMRLFQQNPIVFAAVTTRASVFAQARFAFRRFENGVPQRPFGGRSLRKLERPWPGGSTAELLGKILLRADLAGNAFVWDSGRRLHVWRPDYVTIVMASRLEPDDPAAAEDAEVLGYIYRPGGSRSSTSRFYAASEVAHFAPVEDPLANYRGMSWITTVLRDVQADSAATEHKWKFFDNGATPNMVVKFDPQMTVDQAREFKEMFESEHAGYTNAYKTLFLGGGADATVVGSDFQQLDFSSTVGKGETRISVASGVPATILGVSEGLSGSSLNAGNYSQAKRLFSDVRMQNLWATAAVALEQLVDVPAGAELCFDTRDVPFLQDDLKDTAEIQARQAAAIRQLVDGGFDPATVVAAVQSNDLSLLDHTNMLSVQLQEPGASLEQVSHLEPTELRSSEMSMPTFNIHLPEHRFDIGMPEVHVQVDGVDVHVPEQRQEPPQVTVNVEPTPVRVENTVEVEPTPVTVENQVDNRVEVQPSAAQVTVVQPDEGPSRFQVRRDSQGRISEVVERD